MDDSSLTLSDSEDSLENYDKGKERGHEVNAQIDELQTKLYLSEKELVKVKLQMATEVSVLMKKLECSENEVKDIMRELRSVQQELEERKERATNIPQLDVCVPLDTDIDPMTTRSEFGGKVSASTTLKSEMKHLKKELKKKQELLDSPYRKSQVEVKLKSENRHLRMELQKYEKAKEFMREREIEITRKESKITATKKEVGGLKRQVVELEGILTEERHENQLLQNGMSTAKKNANVLVETTGQLQEELNDWKTESEKLQQELQRDEKEHHEIISGMERRLIVARDALRAANREAEKHKFILNGRDTNHQKELKGMENQLQQMKKMISALTNFMAIQNEDSTKDGTAATVIVTQMKPLIYMSEPAEQECGLNAIYNVINQKSRDKIKQIEGLVPRVKELSESEYEYVKAAAQRTMMKIESDRVYPQYGRGLNIECEYFKQCQGFIKTLDITDLAWDPLYNMCFCSTCNAKRGYRLYFIRGEPPKDYGIPVGWCRFALKVSDAKADTHQIWDKWHVAFHGTSKEAISKVIEVGHLVVPGDTVLGGKKIGVRPFHIPEGESTRKIFLSPTIRYAGMDTYASPTVFTEKESGKALFAKVAFQVRINPQSYQMGGETVGATSQIDPAYLNEELEWFTNEHGSTELYGILVKLTPKAKMTF